MTYQYMGVIPEPRQRRHQPSLQAETSTRRTGDKACLFEDSCDAFQFLATLGIAAETSEDEPLTVPLLHQEPTQHEPEDFTSHDPANHARRHHPPRVPASRRPRPPSCLGRSQAGVIA
jgi:hypothetical protein